MKHVSNKQACSTSYLALFGPLILIQMPPFLFRHQIFIGLKYKTFVKFTLPVAFLGVFALYSTVLPASVRVDNGSTRNGLACFCTIEGVRESSPGDFF